MILDEIQSLTEEKGLKCSMENNALIIENPFHEKNIKIDVSEIHNQWIVEDVCFGDYCYEVFQNADEIGNQEAMEIVNDILTENMYIIVKRGILASWDACYSDDEFDDNSVEEYKRKVQKIKNKKYRLPHSRKVYEFYSWTGYEKLIK